MFDHVGPINRRKGLTSIFCLRDLGMERLACSAKIHIHKYPFRDGAHVEAGRFYSLRNGGSEGEIVGQKTREKNHGTEGFGKIISSFYKFLEIDVVLIYRQVGVLRIDPETESLVEQIELSRNPHSPKESFEDIPKSLQNQGTDNWVCPLIIHVHEQGIADGAGHKAKHSFV